MNTNPRNVRDTFLKFLANALPGVEVWNIRRDFDSSSGTLDQAIAQIKSNALNVQFSRDRFLTRISKCSANIEVVYEDELTAVNVLSQLATVLQASSMVTLLDFSSDTPTPVGGQVYWDPNTLLFRPVADQLAYRQTCTLVLSYQNAIVPGLITLAI